VRGAGEGAAGSGPQPGGEQGSITPQHLRGGTPSWGAGRPRRTHPGWRRAAGGEKALIDYDITPPDCSRTGLKERILHDDRKQTRSLKQTRQQTVSQNLRQHVQSWTQVLVQVSGEIHRMVRENPPSSFHRAPDKQG